MSSGVSGMLRGSLRERLSMTPRKETTLPHDRHPEVRRIRGATKDYFFSPAFAAGAAAAAPGAAAAPSAGAAAASAAGAAAAATAAAAAARASSTTLVAATMEATVN